MFKYKKIISLFVVLLLLFVAAASVNKAIWGHPVKYYFNSSELSLEKADSITMMDDGVIIIHTAVLSGTIPGYAGDVPLDMYIKDEKIIDIKALSNEETPSFFKRASVLFDSWIGKTPAEALAVKVDAVSGATYSSDAIMSNVYAALACYQKSEKPVNQTFPLKLWIALAVTLSACIIPLFVRNKWYHNVQLVVNIIVLGFWCGQFLDYALILKYISDGFIMPVGIIAIIMLTAAFVYPIFGHPQYYCIHICPYGSAQQLVGKIFHYKIKISLNILKFLDLFRKILWASLMLLLLLDCFTEWMDYELFQAFQFQSASWWIIGAAILFLILSTIVNRPYCRFVCPTGSLFKCAENIGS